MSQSAVVQKDPAKKQSEILKSFKLINTSKIWRQQARQNRK